MHLLSHAELAERVRDGENSAVEFKEDALRPQNLAKEVVAMANLDGGMVLIGVGDDGSFTGLNRDPTQVEQWVMQTCRTHIRPEMVPGFQVLRDVQPGCHVAVVHVPRSAVAHALWHNERRQWLIRVGSTSRDASESELQRLFQQRGHIRFEKQAMLGTGLQHLDIQRLTYYFGTIRGITVPTDPQAWQHLLSNTELMVADRGAPDCTASALLVFGNRPRQTLPQHGIAATAFPGTEKDYAMIEQARLDAPLVGHFAPDGALVAGGIVEQALAFVARNTRVSAHLQGGRRINTPEFPPQVIRETVVNALVHRDWLLSSTDIELNVYADRLEVVSPGKLPNGVTPDSMRIGLRAARNPQLRDLMADYGYADALGLGIPRKIIKLMREQRGLEPQFIEDRELQRFTVVLPRAGGSLAAPRA